MTVADESLLNQGIWVLLHTGGNLSSVMGREGPGYNLFPRSVKRMYGWSRGSDYIPSIT
jgi:hypothetical protein